MSRPLVLLLLIAASLLALVMYVFDPSTRDELSRLLQLLARADIAPLRDYILSYGIWAPVVSTALQIVTSVIAPLPSFVLTFVNAMLFGWWWGAVLTWTTAMLAAAICFGLSRKLGRPGVQRFVPSRALEQTDGFFERNGVLAVLIARLIPFINPDIISYAAGLTAMRWKLFMLSIAFGSLPSITLGSYLGSRGFTSVGWLLFVLVGLGLLVMIGGLMSRRKEIRGLS